MIRWAILGTMKDAKNHDPFSVNFIDENIWLSSHDPFARTA